MNKKYAPLFEPAYIGKLKIKNKMAMAPMGPIGYADPHYAYNQRLQDYYVERAKGGIGLIITGVTTVNVDVEGIEAPGMPCVTKCPKAFVHNASQMNERIHAYGTKIFLQMTANAGRSTMPGMVKNMIAPSAQGNRFDPSVQHREMKKEEIAQYTKDFVKGAMIAKRAGFDGVEIHAVHEGYLLDQFAIAIYNHREDEYGGSLENRLRFATDIVKGIKKACGQDFPVSLRFSLKSCMKALRQGGLPGEEYEEAGRDIEEGVAAAKILVAAGYDALNVDAGTYDSWYWNHPPMYFEEEGMYRPFGEILKKEVNVPIILAGRMENPDIAVEALGKSCDIVEYGRQLLADPDYPEKLRMDRLKEVRPCLGCHEGCLGRISKGPISCAVNPACGRESIYGITPAMKKKQVLIIGGGVAGCKSARVAALRGHKVTLVEKSDRLGGNLIPGGMPSFKHYDHDLVTWYEHQLKLLNVDVQLNKELSVEQIRNSDNDVIITATGSKPIVLRQEKLKKAVVADDVLMGRVHVGDQVVIIGGGLVGCETGLWLAQKGKQVTIIEMQKEILGGPHGMPFMNYSMLTDLMKYHHMQVLTNTMVEEVKDDSVTVVQNGIASTLSADTVISAVGYKSENTLYEAIRDLNKPVYNIGDSNQVHNIMYAIWNAYEIVRNI